MGVNPMSKPHNDVKAFRTSRGDVEARIYRGERFVAAVRESDSSSISPGSAYLETGAHDLDDVILNDCADLLMIASTHGNEGTATLFRWTDETTESVPLSSLSGWIDNGDVVPVEQAGGSADIERLGPNRSLV